MRISSLAGNIEVAAPANLEAKVFLSSQSIETNFPITIEETQYHLKSGEATLGKGQQFLSITSLYGHVKFNKK